MTKEMLINTVEGQECRIAIVNQGVLEELYVERVSNASHVGNIYKGRITNVEPSIQAAFVDFGLTKNGFLHISDINPSYFPKGRRSGGEAVGRKRGHRDRPPIQECLRRGQEVIVQLTKEGIGTKGPTMTTYLSVPGRLLVMMPGMSRLGVSRKIEDDQARDKARAILADLNPPADIGFIVRTAAIDRPKREFQRDLNYLLRLWKSVKQRIASSRAPAEIYQESDLVTRTIRDIYNADIDRIVSDNQQVALKVKEFLDVALPRTRNLIELYMGKEGLFHEYGLEQEIEKIYSRRLELPSGGSLVFDQAEALVAIDVNSGRFREHSDAETTATKINVEAAHEIARQLRLRDLGGVIIMDFIDMREERNRRAVEKVLRDEVKNDRAKTKVLRISSFGIVEMTRQRVRPSLKQSIFRTCLYCEGTGLIKNEESLSLLVMRNLQRACSNDQVAQVEVFVTPSVEHHLANFERRRISELEAQFGKRVLIKADAALAGSEVKIVCTNIRGSVVSWEQPTKGGAEARKLDTVSLDQIVPPTAAELAEGELPEEPEEPFGETTPETEPSEEEPPEEEPSLVAPPPEPPAQKPHAPTPAQAPGRPTRAQAQMPQGPAPVTTPGAVAAPDAPAESVDGKKRRRGRRGGRKHRARRERQALAAQQAAQTTVAGAATPAPQAGAQLPPETPPPPSAQKPYERGVMPQPTEEEEISEARELAIEEQAIEPAPQEPPAPKPRPAAPPEPAPRPAGVKAAATSAEGQGVPDQAADKAKRRRRRGGRRHKKPQDASGPGGPQGQTPASAPAQTGAAAHAASQQDARGASAPQASSRAPAHGDQAPAAAPPPARQPAESASQPAPAPQAPSAPAARKARAPRARKGSHRQDKEYYEETSRRVKEAVSKPKDAIPDEEEEDFSTE